MRIISSLMHAARRYCARLIHGWGGRLGCLEGSERGTKRMADMESITMKEVRERVDKLLRQGYDVSAPRRATEAENMALLESGMHLIRTLYREDGMDGPIAMVKEISAQLQDLLEYICDNFVPYLAAVPLKRPSGKQSQNLQREFSSMLSALRNNVEDDADDVDDMYCAIDSEEEDRLFEELDYLVDAQERAEAFRGNAYKFMANSIQKAFLKVVDLEVAFRMVRSSLHRWCRAMSKIVIILVQALVSLFTSTAIQVLQ